MRDRSFARVYYFRGDDDFLKESTARELIDAVLDPATREFNLELIRGDETSAEAIDTVLSTPPMFAERRMVVVRDVHALKKDARLGLEKYLANPAADIVLLLLSPAGEKTNESIAAASFDVDFQPLEDDRIRAWISHHTTTALGAGISDRAAQLLHETAGSDLAALAAELDKLASYTGGVEIDEEAVRTVVGVRAGETLGDLLDAVAVKNGPRAAALVPIVLSQPKNNAVSVVMALATQMAAIAWGRAAKDRNVPPAGIDSGFWALLKTGKGVPGRKWGDAVGCWSRAVSRWTGPELERALGELLVADIAAKETGVSSDEQLLTSLVLALATHPERKAA